MYRATKFTIIIIIISSFGIIEARTVGSNTIVARQQAAYFKTSEVNNLVGFSVFEGGLILQNQNTIAFVDLFFPISGSIVLNNGSLVLQNDVVFNSPFSISSGTIDGGSYAIEFPRNVSSLELPTAILNAPLSVVEQVTVPSNANSIDWSFDDQYIAVGIMATNNIDTLLVYYFDGASITVTASYNFSNQSVNAVAWHPTDYYLAVGSSAFAELSIFYFNPVDGSLNLTDDANASVVNAIAWHPTGNYLAVGQNNNTNLLIYPTASGFLGLPSTTNIGSVSTVAGNALSWDSSGNYLAVGLYKKANLNPEVLVYQFNGSTLTQNGSVSFGQNVYTVAWQPNSNLLAVGLSGTANNMRLYNYNSGLGSLTEITSARVGESLTVYSAGWNAAGTQLAVARPNDSNGFEIKIWNYNATNQLFSLVTGFETSQTVGTLAWSQTGTSLAAGDRASNLYLFDFVTAPLIFNNAKLFFGSDIVLTSTIIFEGVCTLNTDNRAIDFTQGAIEIAPGSTLSIEQSILNNVHLDNIYCVDNTGVLSLRNVTMNLDDNFSFTLGALLFQDSVEITGEYTFAYQSMQTSTILSQSTLTLDIGTLFNYEPLNGLDNLFVFESNSSVLILNGATVQSTLGGLTLTKGKVRIERDSNLAADNSNGITFGDNNAADDTMLDIYSGQTLYLTSGILKYKNVNQSSLRFGNLNSSIYLYSNTSFYAYQNVFLDPGFLTLADGVTIGKVPGVDIYGSFRPFGRYSVIGL